MTVHPAQERSWECLHPDDRLALKQAAAHLAQEFSGVYGTETIERFLDRSFDQFAGRATVTKFLPLLAERGLFVMENQPTNRSLLQGEARRAGVRYAAAPFTLDRAADAASIRTALAQLERRALADGEAVGVMAASNEALDALALWADELASRGVRLAPLSEALK